MATTRDITALMSIPLGINVTPYTARLVRERILPRRGRSVDEDDAANLLLAVAGAMQPEARNAEAKFVSLELH